MTSKYTKSIKTVVLKLEPCTGTTWHVIKIQIPELPFPVSDSAGLGWGPRICISNKFQSGPEHSENHLTIPYHEVTHLYLVSNSTGILSQ